MADAPWTAFYPSGVAAEASYPSTELWGFVLRASRETPHKIALIDGHDELSYRELWHRIACRASWFIQHLKPASRPDDERPRIVCWLPNTVDFVVNYEAAMLAGCAVSMATPALSREEFLMQVKDADPVLVILPRGHERLLIDGVEVLGADELADGRGEELHIPEANPQALAVLQYTSGTTGNAKGAMMTQRNLVANALQNARWFGWQGDVVNLAMLPLCHTWGMCCCLNSTFAVGGTLVLSDLSKHFEPNNVFSEVKRSGATTLYGSATMFHRLIEHANQDGSLSDLTTLRHVKAGAMLSQGDLKTRWDGLFPHAPLQQGYGLTEASPESHNNPPQHFRAGTVGIPIQDTHCRIVDAGDASKELACGQEGEVLLKGPQITKGYWRRPEATQAAFHDGWLLTGDIGVMDADGYLRIVDRKKDLLKFRGYSISPNAIEECLLRFAGVREAVVVGRQDPVDGEIPTAFVVGESVDVDGLKAHCSAKLARYEVPRRVILLDAIPKNHVGKPLRRVLRDRLNSGEFGDGN